MKVTYTAIIIDDEKININLLSKLINRCCPDIEIVATASNFENGIEAILQHKPALLYLLRQESKELEGNPEVKGRIRQLQREAARKRMMAAVPAADVIVTNPTHCAVALAYKSGMAAPKVLAKGLGEIALKIRQVGAENAVPIIEAAPLARALYRHVDLDQEIPATLYAAVAEVLAYIYQLSNWRLSGGHYPMPPLAITVPEELIGEAANG